MIDTPVINPLVTTRNPPGMIQALVELLSTGGGVQGLSGTFLGHLQGIQQSLDAGHSQERPDPRLSDEDQATIIAWLTVLNAEPGLPGGGRPLPVLRPGAAPPSLEGLLGAVQQRALALSSHDGEPIPDGEPQDAGLEKGPLLLERLVGKDTGGPPSTAETGAALRQFLARFAAPDTVPQPPAPAELQPAPPHGPLAGAVDTQLSALPAARPLAIDLPLRAPNWDQALGQRVVWMLAQDTQRAELRINPPQLGPVQIQISVEGDKTQLSFHAHHAVVKEALEVALPRLREMIADAGLNLVNVQVAEHGSSRGQGENPFHHGAAPGVATDPLTLDEESGEEPKGLRPTALRALGLVDDYA